MKTNFEIKDLDEIVKTPNFIQELLSKLMTFSKNSNEVPSLILS